MEHTHTNGTFPPMGGPDNMSCAPVASHDHSEIVVCGVPLAFPFPPYPSQICLANQMIRAFKSRKHALLESPTGTGDFCSTHGTGIRYQCLTPAISPGKTLAIVCSSIAWQQAEKARLKEGSGCREAAACKAAAALLKADGSMASSMGASTSGSTSVKELRGHADGANSQAWTPSQQSGWCHQQCAHPTHLTMFTPNMLRSEIAVSGCK